MLFVIAFIVSFIPYTALFLWLRGRSRDNPAYGKLCSMALGYGALSLFPVTLFSGVSYIIVRLTGLHNSNPLLYQAVYTIIVLALMEELAKYMLFRHVIKKTPYPCSWLDMTVLMTIVGIGFGAIEAVIYSIGASIPVVLVRGICVPHAGFGFLVGYFCGKSAKCGKPVYKWVGFLIAWLLHGIYDFSLSEEFLAINDNLAIVAILLALLDVVLVIRLIVFVKKAKKSEIYIEALDEKAVESEGQYSALGTER